MHLAARLGFLTVTACLLANSAIAETGPTMRIRGTIDTLDGQAMTVTSREGTKLPITLAERADLKLGAPVFLIASKNAEGGLSATRVIVGKDGVAPPM